MAQISIADATTVVDGNEDIAQCIYIALSTIKGSDPLRPAFGSNLHKYLDRPLAEVKTHVIIEANNAIRQWEPRIAVKKIQPVQNTDGLTLYITAEIIDTGAIADINVTI
jgi:phage baseplate assembly protein W